MMESRPWVGRYKGFVFLLMLGLNGQTGCRSVDPSDSKPKFDWNTNLPPLETKPRSDDINAFDSNFCKGKAPGSCLSLVLRMPRNELIADIGLSTLALGAESKNFRLKMDEACQAAFTEYRQKYLYDKLKPIRSQTMRKLDKTRCIFVFMGEESAQEDIKLGANELGLSARLTKFDITADTKGAEVGGVGLSLTKLEAVTDFRTAYIYSGKDLKSAEAGWQMAEGHEAKPYRVKSQLNRDLSWKLDLAALKENIAKIDVNGSAVDDKVGAFVGQAKTLLGNMSSLNNPLQSSLVLVSIGYNAFRGLCGEDLDKCKVYTSSEPKNQSLKDDLADLVPSSETNELLRMAMIRSIQGILDGLFTQTNAEQIKKKFELK